MLKERGNVRLGRRAGASVQHLRRVGWDATGGWGIGMGLLDRDYYRDDDGGPIAAWVRHGLVTKILVAINIVVYLVQISTQERGGVIDSGPFTHALALIGERVVKGEAWRLVSYAFLSSTAALAPFLVNTPLLWVVGHEVEDRLGRRRFLAYYLFATVLCGAAFVGAAALRLGGTSLEQTAVVGCTAPLTAMLAFLALQSPRMKLTFFYSLSLPVWLLLLLAIVPDVYGLAWHKIPGDDGRKLTLAGHLGGVLVALIFHAALRQAGGRARPRRVPPSDADIRLYRDDEPLEDDRDEVPAPVAAASDLDEHLEAQLDAVLAKVAAHGQQSLTGAEREILKRASEVYRKRRR